METAVSSASASADLQHYLRTRFGPVRFALLALFLALASAALDDSEAALVLGRALLVLPWLLQFRLADDLADRQRDRREHPERVLARAPPGPFRVLLILLAAGNVLVLAWCAPPPRWAELLTLTGLALLWYVWPHRRVPPLAAALVVLLKYPAFVYLLGDPGASLDRWVAVGVLVLVYACFVAYECLHDERLRTVRAATVVLAAALLAMTAAAVLAWRGGLADACWLGAGCAVLADLFRRHCRHRAPGLWPYAVLLVGCAWITCAYWLASR
jgi:hypothetical protein